MKPLSKALTVAIALFTTPCVYAMIPTYNHISFGTEVSQKIANNQLFATLNKTIQATDATQVADGLTKTINQALAIAKNYPEVTAVTGRQHTYPRYNASGKITGFTGSISLELRSQDFAKSSELIAHLQSLMTVNDIKFDVSEEVKKDIENQLITQTAKKFQQEAQIISQAFGASSYKIVNVQLNSSNHHVRAMPMMAMAKMTNDTNIDTQHFESGDSTVSYQATGTIELIK